MATDIKQKVLYELQVNGVDKASGGMKELEGASDGVAGSFAGIPPQAAIVAGAVAAVAAAMVVLTKAAIDNTNAMSTQGAALYNNASAANVTIEEYQALNYVLRQTTGQMNGAEKQYRSINTFLLSAAGSTSIQGQALADLNLEYDDLFAMNPQERYMALTNAVGALTDKTKQNTIAAAIFGARYSSQVVAALNQSGGSMQGMMDTFRESNLILSTESVTAMKKYDDAVTDFQMGMDVLKGDLAVGTIPILEKLMVAFQNILPVLRDELSDVIPIVTERGIELVEMGITAIPMLMDLIGGFSDTATNVDEFLSSLEPAVEELGDLLQFLQPLGEAILEITFVPMIEGLTNTYEMIVGIVNFIKDNQSVIQTVMDVTSLGLTAVSRNAMDAMVSTQQLNESYERQATVMNALASLREVQAQAMLTEGGAAVYLANVYNSVSSQAMGWIGSGMEKLHAYAEEISSVSGASAAPVVARPVAEAADPFEILGFGNLENVELAYQEITMVAINEEELKQEALASIQADWREQYYDTYMQFSGDVVTTFVNSWENGFSDLDDMMKKMIQDWMKEMVASGILTLFSSAVGGGSVGIFGKLLGKGGKGGK